MASGENKAAEGVYLAYILISLTSYKPVLRLTLLLTDGLSVLSVTHDTCNRQTERQIILQLPKFSRVTAAMYDGGSTFNCATLSVTVCLCGYLHVGRILVLLSGKTNDYAHPPIRRSLCSTCHN